MGQSLLFEHMQATLVLFATMTAPPLIAALIVGLLVGVLQAATQIQDQTLPLTCKIITVLAVMALSSSLMFRPLIEHTERVMTDFPTLTR